MAYINIIDIKQMYERWSLGNSPNIPPLTNALLESQNVPSNTVPFQYPYSSVTDSNTPYILYVHGWNMDVSDKDSFAESAFKRMYWQGYNGRFGSFRWPTGYGFTGAWTQLASSPTEKNNYDDSEYQAWLSAQGLLTMLTKLNAKYPGRVYVIAHSMGNVVTGEALRLAENNQVVNTYVASQAAITAHTYDSSVANYSFYDPPLSLSAATPNIYGDWFSDIYGGAAENVVSLYNTNDYALQRSVWQLDQLLKPDQYVSEPSGHWDYLYNGHTNDPSPWNHFYKEAPGGLSITYFDIVNVITNRYEVMAYAAQPYTTALGATPGVQNIEGSLNLMTVWLPDTSGHNYTDHFWHSAEFRGDPWQQWNYWNTVLYSSRNGFNLSP